MKKNLFLTILLLFQICLYTQSQQVPAPGNKTGSRNERFHYTTLNAHSHNDYANVIPFWLAYNNHFGSIEADIWAVNGGLFVAHGRSEIKPERTLDALYISPILKQFTENKGKAWSDRESSFQLMIDLKTPVEPTLSLLVEKLKQYPAVFDPQVSKNAVRIVITGNRPDPADFNKYPAFIFFDGILKQKYDGPQLNRVALYSEDLKKIISWNGDGEMTGKEKTRLQSVIDSVHTLGIKVRFWNAPDNVNAWNVLMKMNCDYINTDRIEQLSEYLNNLGKM